MRDEFNSRTKETIAKRARYLCSNPVCRQSTIGSAPSHDGFLNVGVAAHITAAAPGGPRYDQSLTREQRRHQSNGIWLCQTHAKLIDSDAQHFTVEMLREWKRTVEKQSLQSILTLSPAPDQRLSPAVPDTEDRELIERLNLPARDHDLESLTSRLIRAAQSDLSAFKHMPVWPRHSIALNLRLTDGDSVRAFNVSALATAIETFKEIAVVAPPGTGKTTTLLQMVDAILLQGKSMAAFVPLGEWSSQSGSLLQYIVRRQAFAGIGEEHLKLLAHFGRLVLIMDGWNELDEVSRKRARGEIRALEREFPSLGIVISTRRQALDVPISGPAVEIDSLTHDQQIDIARALRSSQGEAILDHAWRTPGVRDLVTIPLYLTTLVAHMTSGDFPTTKEEVLRLFVTQHEQDPDKAEALREAVLGFHTEMLTALAVEAARAANTTISDTRARAVVKEVEDRLSADGQITIAPQPMIILDTLVNYHTLVRSGPQSRDVSFQHQQFQEWYGSFHVETLMRAAAAGDPDSKHRLKTDVLNMPAWEEAILFACERLSRDDRTGLQGVATSILEAMAIDPILGAEMIYRSSSSIWDMIKEKIVAFVERWHVRGKVDRAVRFMITSGRSDFASLIWPLISDPDTQIHLRALRASARFRPSVLGPEVENSIAQLPEEQREHIASGIASESGLDGIELAVRLAQADTSAKVKVSVIEALLFRRADRFALEILRTAPDEVWRLLARKGYAEEIGEPEAAARLRYERQRYFEEETQPLSKLHVLVHATNDDMATPGSQVRCVIEEPDFPVREQDARWIVHDAYKRYPNDVATALLHRLEAGLEIPYGTTRLLQSSGIVVDEGPIVEHVIHANVTDRVAEAALGVIGPGTIGTLIDTLIVIDRRWRSAQGHTDEASREQYHRLVQWICDTKLVPFVQALLDRSTTVEPREIALLADLVTKHGHDAHETPLPLEGERYERMIAVIGHWAEILLVSPTATRAQLANVASAIGRLAAPQLTRALQRLLAEDLSRWRQAYDEFSAALKRGAYIQSDAQTSWTLQYRRAFAAIGDNQVVEIMKTYLPDSGYCGFGFDAARVLRDIWHRVHNPPKEKLLALGPDFSDVRNRRTARQNGDFDRESSPFAEAIFAVVDDLIKPGSNDDDNRHALRLAKIAFSMPYGNKKDVIDRLLQLPTPVRVKQELLTVLVLAGEIIRADMILEGIRSVIEDAKARTWLLHENYWELERWLELLPFSDRPERTLDGLELLESNLRQPWRLRRLLSALGYAPSPEAEHVLTSLPQRDASFLSEHDWLNAVERRGAISTARNFLDLVCGDTFVRGSRGRDTRTLSEKLANMMCTHPEFRSEVYQRYESLPSDGRKAILEQAIAEAPDADGVLLLIGSYAAEGKSLDGVLSSAIRDVALGKRPSEHWAGAHEVFSVPVPELRQKLFALTNNDTAEARLAAACITAIDELRDDYGPVESEPRHPDIDSGRAWPLEMSLS